MLQSTTAALYTPDVILDPVNNVYVCDGIPLARVSTVARRVYPHTFTPASQQQANTWERAREDGTVMHARIEGFFQEAHRDVDKARRMAGDHFARYMETRGKDWEVVAFEQMLVSRTRGFAGRFDLLVYDRSDQCYILVDWKRTKRLYKSSRDYYTTQLNLYRCMLMEEHGLRVDQMVLVLLHPDLAGPVEVSVDILDVGGGIACETR